MTQPKDPKGFLVVLPGEIIEIPQDSDKSWLTLFYSLPKELAEKWKPAFDLPRCPYEVLRTDKYDSIVCDDMFKLLVWDCYKQRPIIQSSGYNGSEPTRICPHCGKEKPLSDFGYRKMKKGENGQVRNQSWCKDCR